MQLTRNYSHVRAKVRGATEGDRTALHAGIESARLELLSERARAGTEKVIVLMTDGQSSYDAAMAQAQLAIDRGMTIHCVGLGTDIDYGLLDAIAADSGGIALYVDNATDVNVYGPQLKAVFRSLAQNEVGVGLIE